MATINDHFCCHSQSALCVQPVTYDLTTFDLDIWFTLTLCRSSMKVRALGQICSSKMVHFDGVCVKLKI